MDLGESMINVTVFVHGSDEHMYETGEQIGLKGDVLWNFSHSCDEFELELEVDVKTGLSKVVKIDGRRVLDE